MRNALVVLTLSLLSLASGLVLAGGVKMKNGSYPEKAATWKKFTLRDVKLGAEFYKVAGFTCGPDPASKGFTTYRHTCVKFLDDRCKGKPTKIHHIREAADVPAGQSCFMDEGNGGTYLDRKFMSPPLSSIAIVATDTTAPLVYEIAYTLARDTLTDESNLGKALIQKYGRPSNAQEPTQMTWKDGDVGMDASCGGTEGPTGDYCRIKVEDTTLLDTERSIQQAADSDDQKKTAPPAPKL